MSANQASSALPLIADRSFTSNDESEKTEILKKAARMATQAYKLLREVDGITSALVTQNDDVNEAGAKAAEAACEIQWRLEDITDEKPKYFLVNDYANFSAPENPFARVTMYEDCFGEAQIGGHDLELSDLKAFRDWLDTAIDWCERHGAGGEK